VSTRAALGSCRDGVKKRRAAKLHVVSASMLGWSRPTVYFLLDKDECYGPFPDEQLREPPAKASLASSVTATSRRGWSSRSPRADRPRLSATEPTAATTRGPAQSAKPEFVAD